MSSLSQHYLFTKMVGLKGLEPSRVTSLVPKTSVSTIPPQPHKISWQGLKESNFYLTVLETDILPIKLSPQKFWSDELGLNQRHHPYERCVLPTELSSEKTRHLCIVFTD